MKDYLNLELDLHIVPLKGCKRSMLIDDTDLPRVMPSPNCQNLDAALCYTGTCIFKGTNCSEEQGTAIHFHAIGAPFIDSSELERRMTDIKTPGIHFRRISFYPTFGKHQCDMCRGVQMHITDRDKLQRIRSILAFVR